VSAEKTRQLYELGIRRFFEISGFRSGEHALFILRERGADAALSKFVKALHGRAVRLKTIHSYVEAFPECHDYNNRQPRRLLPRKQVVEDVRPLSKSRFKPLLNMLRPVKRLACWIMFALGLRAMTNAYR
jgi:hypothetical protein